MWAKLLNKSFWFLKDILQGVSVWKSGRLLVQLILFESSLTAYMMSHLKFDSQSS